MLVVVVFSRLWRRSGVLTDVEFMELRYAGRPAAVLRGFKAIYQMLFVHCMTMGWVFLAMRKLLSQVLGLGSRPLLVIGAFELTPDWAALLGCVVLTMVYCEVSGLWGVVVTDFFQFIVAMSGSIALMVCVVRHFGGVGALVDGLRHSVHAAALSTSPPDTGQIWHTSPAHWSGSAWEFVIFIGLIWCANKNADGGGVVIQRMLAAKDERHALLGTLWYAVANFALRSWPWILVALATLLVLPQARWLRRWTAAFSVAAPVDGRVVAADGAHVLVAPADGSPAWRWPCRRAISPTGRPRCASRPATP